MLQELNESGYNTTLDDFFDRRVLLFREKLAELGSSIELALGVV